MAEVVRPLQGPLTGWCQDMTAWIKIGDKKAYTESDSAASSMDLILQPTLELTHRGATLDRGQMPCWHWHIICSSTIVLLTLPHSMRQGLCTVSVRLLVRLSGPFIDRCMPLRRVCCCGPGGQEISISTAFSSKCEQCHQGGNYPGG